VSFYDSCPAIVEQQKGSREPCSLIRSPKLERTNRSLIRQPRSSSMLRDWDDINLGKSEGSPETALKQGRMRPSGVTTSYSGCVFWKKSGFRADMITCRTKVEFYLSLTCCVLTESGRQYASQCKHALFFVLLDGFTQCDMITSHSQRTTNDFDAGSLKSFLAERLSFPTDKGLLMLIKNKTPAHKL
jgi:hypothetical protein